MDEIDVNRDGRREDEMENKKGEVKMETNARLKSKFGGTLEDVNIILPFDLSNCTQSIGWVFISKFINLPKTIINRYSMIYVPTK